MYRKSWDVHDLIGKHARVKLVDASSSDWGHINFDDLKGDIICKKDWEKSSLQNITTTNPAEADRTMS